MIDGAMQPFALTLDKFLTHAARWHPHRHVVTAHEDGRIDRVSYFDLYRRSLRISAVLQTLGVQAGDRVATLAWNTQAHIEALYAIMGIGAACHTLNPRLTGAQSALMLEKSAARILILSADLLPLAREILSRPTAVEQVLLIDGLVEEDSLGLRKARVHPLETRIAAATGAVTWGGFDERSPSGLCFTSGTTGSPKGVTYTHRSSYLHTLRMLQTDVMAISGTDTVLAVVPLFHANAWGLPFAVPAVGGNLVLNGRHADGARLASLINHEKVTLAVGVATVWLGLVEHLEATGATVASLERVIVGGSPLSSSLMDRIERQLGVTVQTSWGMTELSPSGTVAARHDVPRSAALSGRPAVGVDLLLTDEAGNVLAEQRGSIGHLRVRGASVIERYFGENQPATDAAGWLPTGDLAQIDAAGNLMITGRSKDLIKSGGEWINPVEIESLIGQMPEVSLAAVIGRADRKWGERPILLVELREPDAISDEALLERLEKHLPSWWLPDAIVRLEHMPLTSTGKIDRLRLRSEYGGARV